MILPLPPPQPLQKSLATCLATRRTRRHFSEHPLSLEQVAQILWAAQSTTHEDGKRTTPSAAGLNPLRIRLAVQQVTGIVPGVYDYNVQSFCLERRGDAIARQDLVQAGLGEQPWLGDAELVVAITAQYQPVLEHFKMQPPANSRGERYIMMETGALAQNVHLQCTALGLGQVLVAGFNDDRAHQVLSCPADERVTALLCIGI